MVNRVEKTNMGEGVKETRVRTTSDDVGGKSVSDKWVSPTPQDDEVENSV